MIDDRDEFFDNALLKSLSASISADLSAITHTHNLGVTVFTNEPIMRLYLSGYKKGRMGSKSQPDDIEVGVKRLREAYKKHKIILDELERSFTNEYHDDWFEMKLTRVLNSNTVKMA